MMLQVVRLRLQTSLVVGLVLAGVGLLLLRPGPVYAGGVVGTGSSASCTEAALVAKLAGGGTVTFNCGGAKTITLTSYKEIGDDTTINGGGLITLSGSNTFLFQVFFGKTLILQNITLANGQSNVTGAIENFGTTTIINSQLTNNRSTNTGGAILNHGALNLVTTILSNNRAANDGGGIYNNSGSIAVYDSQLLSNVISGTTGTGGGISNNSGSLSIQNSTFSGNSGFDGGAIYVSSGATAAITASFIISNSAGYGAGLENSGTSVISRTTFTLNRATVGDGGGIWNLNGQLTLSDSTVSNNTAATTGGGISNYGNSITLSRVTISGNTAGTTGGGIHNVATASLVNVTLSGNQATPSSGGGGIYQNGGTSTLNFVTVANNTATFGAGVYNEAGAGAMNLRNTLLTNNLTGNCDGDVDSLGHNLSSDTNCANFNQTGDQQNASLPLGPLGYYAGPTLTRPPLSGNPAINGGICVGGVTTDQRRLNRPYGSTCDVGAVEVQPLPVYTPVVLKKS
ncbi:MAG: hypothetical protein DPW09_23600 [Anaerolineae bacterium]|nr:hypothetical protein [Anaerolineales bacterium]MCQ3976427.1 hypothetical protein [Anaerolineae bacterium]